ncbi:Spc24-domain-containing protein [Metschnikowia bicuspidata var. bicuspidata NRRL YB-4993]|uniref:Kinetochore protein Spc24 n=1 Tax=Metschnikowia bicuspidata var. bicuspidata NRRL YB-4993 TaxID=869754 RepID=A0A1A0HGL0_9ASCO|nr:Spc24-domain-containing protein [Metschnikowia bicuspidata var. bicuspidata NRRL YB-4993]OBA23130.1 Spc24-domain-containing protein [Metschnikowia bicuspidata var. bicuspidata NRRL YB-4993]
MLDEPPEKLISQAVENFETQPDVACIGRFNELAQGLSAAWKNEENRMQAAVSALENELRSILAQTDVLKQPTDEVFERLHLPKHSAGEDAQKPDALSIIHQQTASLDNKKISLAKQLTEIESALMQARAAERELAQREAEILEQRAAALATNAATNVSLATMRIMLFKKLGIHIEDAGAGGNDKIVMFSENSSAPPKTLDVDPKFLDYFISNYIWDEIGNNAED